ALDGLPPASRVPNLSGQNTWAAGSCHPVETVPARPLLFCVSVKTLAVTETGVRP
ncbi:MAG: hypothetical protein QOJ78_192, partial [Pseudonocardiales bacterium]|nr:hypothetical protein [Pseudonocardiales bacterium]